DEPESALPVHVARLLGVREADLQSWRILRKSLDARNKDRLQFTYALEVGAPELVAHAVRRSRRARNAGVRVEPYAEAPFLMPGPGALPLDQRPVVIGSGPGGLVAAYFLAEQGYGPLVLERGRPVRDRIRDVHA